MLENDALTEQNTEYSSPREALAISDKVLEENNYLYQIEYAFYYRPFIFKFVIFISYVIIRGYILYYYPFPIIYTLCLIVYNIMEPYMGLMSI